MIPCKSIPTLSLNLIKSFVSLFLHIFQSIIDLFKIIDIYYYYSLLTANGNPENASYIRQVIDEARKADGDYDALMTSWKNIMTFYKKSPNRLTNGFGDFYTSEETVIHYLAAANVLLVSFEYFHILQVPSIQFRFQIPPQ